MTDPITILIVDDHEVVRKGVRGYLDTLAEFEVVAEAQSGEQAVDLAQKYVPDVILMDLVLPGMDGVETTRIIKNTSPRTQIVVLTSFHDDALVFPALKAGAISYILKDMKMDKLAEVVRKAHRGEVILHPKVAARVLHNIRKENQASEEIFTELTDREMEVLKLIAKGYSNSQIAEDLVISENTVKGHVSNILSKLHLADRTQAAVYAWKQGIVKRESVE
jgi:NarL family two-component system response regulator LiaR